MWRIACAATTALALVLVPVTQGNAQDPKTDVLAAVNDFMEGLRSRDVDRIAARIDSTTRLTLVRPGPNGSRVVVIAGSDFVKMATGPTGRRSTSRSVTRSFKSTGTWLRSGWNTRSAARARSPIAATTPSTSPGSVGGGGSSI